MDHTTMQAPRTGSVARPGDHEREHARILDATVRLASARPWTALSVDAICADAGVPSEAFALRFTSVEACFVAATEDALERLVGAVVERTDASHPSGPDRVAALVAGFVGFLVAERERAWIAVAAPLGGPAREARRRTVRRLIELAGEPPEGTGSEDRVSTVTIGPQLAALWELGRQYLAGTGGLRLEDAARSTVFRILSPRVSRDEAMRCAFATPMVLDAPGVDGAVDGAG